MEKKILIIIIAVLLISVFLTGKVYAPGEPTSGGTTGTGTTTPSGTGSTGTDSQTTQTGQNQEVRVPGVINNYYATVTGGDPSTSYNGDTKTSTLKTDGGTINFYEKGAEGKLGKKISSVENFHGTMEFKNGEIYKIVNNGDGKKFENIPSGKDGRYSFYSPSGSTTLHEPGKPWEILGNGKPMEVKEAPNAKVSSGTPDPIQYKNEKESLKLQIGDKSLTIPPQKDGNSRFSFWNINGVYYGGYDMHNLQSGDYQKVVFGNGQEINLRSIVDQSNPNPNRNDKIFFIGGDNQIPKDASGNSVSGSYVVMNSNGKIDYNNIGNKAAPAVLSLGGIGENVYAGGLPGSNSGISFGNSNGVTQVALTGDKLAQVELDEKVFDSHKVDVGGKTETMVTYSSGGNFAPSGSKAPNKFEINFGESITMNSETGGKDVKIQGKIVGTYDGDKIRMATVPESADSSKVIERLRNHEIVEGEIMYDNSRVAVNPPNAPENTKPPEQIKPPVEPVPPVEQPKPEPPKVPSWYNTQNPAAVLAGQQGGVDFSKPPQLIAYHFRADWCGPCKALETSGVYGQIKSQNPNIKFVEVDLSDKNPNSIAGQVAARFGVSGIPAISFLDPTSGNPIAFKNPQGGSDVHSVSINSQTIQQSINVAMSSRRK